MYKNIKRTLSLLSSTLLALFALAPMAASAQQGGGLLYYSGVEKSFSSPYPSRLNVSLNSVSAYVSGRVSVNIQTAISSVTNSSGSISFTVSPTSLAMTCYENDNAAKPRASYSWSASDYTNLASGVVGRTGVDGIGTGCGITYTHNFAAGTEYIVGFDTSSPGVVSMYLKEGAGADAKLADIAMAEDQLKSVNVGRGTSDGEGTCTSLAANEINVQVLSGSTAEDLSLSKDAGACSAVDQSTYNSSTKVANIKNIAGNSSGVVVKHSVVGTGTTVINVEGAYLEASTSLTYNSGGFPTDYLSFSDSAAQQVYFSLDTVSDGKAIPKDAAWPIAGGIFDMLAGDIDLAGNSVKLDTSATDFKALAHNLNTVTKDGSFTLFVPYKTGTSFVGICAGASEMAAVNDKCSGIYYLKDGQTKTDADTKSIPAGKSVKATIITLNGNKFWQIDGLTGSGGFSAGIASDPATGISVSTMSMPVVMALIAVTISAALLSRRFAGARNKR